MSEPGQAPAPTTVSQAVAMAEAGLAWLATADVASLPAAEQAECLRALERMESRHTAARARVLGVFNAQAGYEDDGHGSARSWLRWQTRVTGTAAGGAIGWSRRLSAHPDVAGALAGGEISPSWARQLCDWTELLPEGRRAEADALLLGAAAAGADLPDLGRLAEEMRRRCAPPDSDRDDGFPDRRLRLETTLGGAGRLDGDLTPQCTVALQAVLDALGKRTGPEDLRTKGQREHDALEEACRRLVGSDCLPQRGGQPTHIQLHMTLDQLRGLPGADAAEAVWAGAVAGPGADCDATIVPVVTGHVDPQVLDRLAAAMMRGTLADPGAAAQGAARALRAARRMVLSAAADLLSGPGGLAAFLRTGPLGGLAASVSLPLDVGAATETIPAHLRRAVIARDRCCAFPGCQQPPAACEVHHIRPRSEGGPTELSNLVLACAFHHKIVVHRWGWQIELHPDGTRTARSPDGRVLHSHGPPSRAA
jgi:Domain of unknown function (DUF222)/HNH endonuclease